MSKKAFSALAVFVLMLVYSHNVYAHSPFIMVDPVAEAGRELNITVKFGHYPHADGRLLRGTEIAWRLFLQHPDGTEEDLPVAHVTDGDDEYITSYFTPSAEGYYRVVFQRNRTRNMMIDDEQQRVYEAEMVRAYIKIGGADILWGFDYVPHIAQLEILPVTDIARLSPGMMFEGQVLYQGVPLADGILAMEVEEHVYAHFQTDENGYFRIRLTEKGTFILTARHFDDTPGTANDEEIVGSLNLTLLMLPVFNEPAEDVDLEELDDSRIELPDDEPEDSQTENDTGSIPTASLIIGGSLLFGAGFLFGSAGKEKIKKSEENENG